MAKLLSIPSAIIVAAVAFIVLFVILGVTLWVSLLVAGCLLVVLGAPAVFAGGRSRPLAH